MTTTHQIGILSDSSRKTVGTILLVAVVRLSIGPAPAQTAVTIDSRRVYPGTTVPVNARVTRATNVVATQFDVTFDGARVSAGSAERGSQLGGHVFRSRQVAPGVVRMLAYSMNNAAIGSTNLAIASIPFTLATNERTGSGPLTLSNVVLATRDGTAIVPVLTSGGSLFVNPVFLNPDGTANFFLPSQPDERYLIQASTNLINWVNILTNVATGNFLDLVDADSPYYPHRFYRSALFDALGQVSSITRSANGAVVIQVAVRDGRTYVLQASSDMKQWVDIDSKVAIGSRIQFTDANGPSQRFYRLKSSQ